MVMPTQKGDGQTCMPSGQRPHQKAEPESKYSQCSVLHPTPFPVSALKWPAQSVQSLSQVFSSKWRGEAPVTTQARKRRCLGQPPTVGWQRGCTSGATFCTPPAPGGIKSPSCKLPC